MYMDRQIETTTSTYDQQIYFYNRGYLPHETQNKSTVSHQILASNLSTSSTKNSEIKLRTKHSTKENSSITIIRNSRPRFPNLQMKEFEMDSKRYFCLHNESSTICDSKTSEYKEDILTELRKVLIDESNVLKVGLENPYNVHYDGERGNYMTKSPKQVLCELKKVNLRMLKRSDVSSHPLRDYLPKRNLFENRNFNSCAIVSSAGALKDSNLGQFIDSHDLVLRFNHAPTKGFENDVGNKTTIRVINSQVIAKKEYNFLRSNLYKNITIVAWDPSNYSSSINEWLQKPEFNMFPNYMEYRKRDLKSRFFILNSQSIWEVWKYLQSNSPSRLRRNPPSSGFLGLSVLLPYCNFVDMFEYVPSTRVTRRCHYYDPENNAACTFGVWHPLAAEKLLTYYVNFANDYNVFQKGFVRITGFKNLNC